MYTSNVQAWSTYYISDCTPIGEPPIRQAIAKINAIPWQAGLSQAPAEVLVVSDVGEGVAEYELHHLAIVSIHGNS